MIKSIVTGCMFLSFVFAAHGQRIAVDFSSSLDNIYTSLLYCHVFKGSWYVKSGVATGIFGRGTVKTDLSEVYAGKPLVSPYAAVNEGQFPDLPLAEYNTTVRGVSLETGVGKFFELGPIHTLRIDMQVRGYRIREHIYAAYSTNQPDTLTRYAAHDFKRSALSVGPEFFHAIRITGRLTCYYGIKLPFFLPFSTAGYHPKDRKDQTTGFQPNLSIGMSCAITKKIKTNN